MTRLLLLLIKRCSYTHPYSVGQCRLKARFCSTGSGITLHTYRLATPLKASQEVENNHRSLLGCLDLVLIWSLDCFDREALPTYST